MEVLACQLITATQGVEGTYGKLEPDPGNWFWSTRDLTLGPQINADLAIAHLDATCKYTSSHKNKRRMSQVASLIIPSNQDQGRRHNTTSIELQGDKTPPAENVFSLSE